MEKVVYKEINFVGFDALLWVNAMGLKGWRLYGHYVNKDKGKYAQVFRFTYKRKKVI